MTDARQILAITSAVRAAVVDAVDGRCPVEIAVSRAMAAVIGPVDEAAPAERPSERNRRQNAEAMAQIAKLEHEGRGRSAVGIVARRLAADPNDAAEVIFTCFDRSVHATISRRCEGSILNEPVPEPS